VPQIAEHFLPCNRIPSKTTTMMLLNRHSVQQCVTVTFSIAVVLCTFSCTSLPKSNSPSISRFVSSNADGYPELVSTNKKMNATINQKLVGLVDSWHCQNGGESQFDVIKHTLGMAFLSVEYAAMQLCDGMPSAASTNSAVTFSMVDGSEIALETLTQCSSNDYVEQKIKMATNEARVENCPKPHFSGDYYLEKNTVTLMNFYPLHIHSGCEFEITKKLPNIVCE